MGCPALPFSYDHDVLARASELGSGSGSNSRSPSLTPTGILRQGFRDSISDSRSRVGHFFVRDESVM